MEELLKKCNELQRNYSSNTSRINEEKKSAKKFAIDLVDSILAEEEVLDIGGEDFYKDYGKNTLVPYNLPADMHYMDFKERYNGVMAMHVLEHSPCPLLVLRNIHNALKENGILYVAVPESTPFLEKGLADHLTMMSKDMWGKLLVFSGFKILEESRGKFNPNWYEYRFLCQKEQ